MKALWSAKEWFDRRRLPPAAKEVLRQERALMVVSDPGPAQVIEECVLWLGRAQDHSLSNDGGVARHYSLIDGWARSYPETTGYIVPTLINHGVETGHEDSIGRARRMLDWLVSIQFAEGAFQGGMVHQTPRVPVTFNSGQILIGLASGVALDARYREPMQRCADWMVRTQDPDGCWRSHPTPFATGGEKTYETHAALGLIHAAMVDSERGYLEAALRQVDWALRLQTENGWLAKCCLSNPENPLTHTLGYALRGIIGAYSASKDERYLRGACRTADGLMEALDQEGRLPGRLDARWKPAVDWVCLTGTAQIAQCFLLLHKATGRDDYLRAGMAGNAFVRRTISLDGPPEIRGGVKGSFPVDGSYGPWQYLNWACKFVIDANREEIGLAYKTPRGEI